MTLSLLVSLILKENGLMGRRYKSAVTNEEMWGGSLDKYARWLKDFIPLKDGGFFFSFKYDQDYFVKYINGSVSIYANLISWVA